MEGALRASRKDMAALGGVKQTLAPWRGRDSMAEWLTKNFDMARPRKSCTGWWRQAFF